MPQTLSVKFKEKQNAALNTSSFLFEKPDGYVFRAGQYAEMTLQNPPETDAEGNRRTFSISSAPHENFLMFTTRIRNTAFKRVLGGLGKGDVALLDGPFGSFTLHHDASRPAVFLAGGIGITPVRSIVVEAARNTLPHRIYVIYSSRTPQDAPFLDELKTLESKNPKYALIPTMTAPDLPATQWDGTRGRITADMLRSLLVDLQKPVFYVSGPPNMVSGLRSILVEAGVNEDNIRFEEFAGY
jgi:ferredoxin-NADP reductase